jgi:uroporphyrinogen-III synthase/uroporphyrinogen III methyltransferase/synthase
VLVTRAAHQAGKLSEGLRRLGAEPVEVPVLEICALESYAPLDAALRQLGAYDWLILTSANTVRVLLERSAIHGAGALRRQLPKVAAVGEATAAAAEAAGFQITLTPVSYVAESLLEALTGEVSEQRILIARAAVARDVIPDALRAAGAMVEVVDAYRNGIPAGAPEQLARALADGIDAAAFTSSSSVVHLAEVARRAGIAFPFAGVAAVSIGPITSQTLRKAGWPPAAEASPHDVPGLIAAVAEVLRVQR